MISLVDGLPLRDSGLDGPASAIGVDLMGNVLELSVTNMKSNGFPIWHLGCPALLSCDHHFALGKTIKMFIFKKKGTSRARVNEKPFWVAETASPSN